MQEIVSHVGRIGKRTLLFDPWFNCWYIRLENRRSYVEVPLDPTAAFRWEIHLKGLS